MNGSFARLMRRTIRKVGLSCVYRGFPRRVLINISVFIDDGPVVLFRLLRTSARLSRTRVWSTLKKYRRGILLVSSLLDFVDHPSQPALDPTPGFSHNSHRKDCLSSSSCRSALSDGSYGLHQFLAADSLPIPVFDVLEQHR